MVSSTLNISFLIAKSQLLLITLYVYCKVGGASLQHSAVYEEFAICLPGFLPSAPSLSAAGAKEGGFMRLEVHTYMLYTPMTPLVMY